MKPFVSDIEELTLVDAAGDVRVCSRERDAELFSLVCGGYGLFGAVYSAKLRSSRSASSSAWSRCEMDGVMDAFDNRITEGFLYGDFQFAIDPSSADFLRRGVFSCYRPVADDAPIPEDQRALTREDWARLLYLTHADKAQAFTQYAEHYLAKSGQLYYSDAHQFADYEDDYHRWLDEKLGATDRATEMIMEIYVPRATALPTSWRTWARTSRGRASMSSTGRFGSSSATTRPSSRGLVTAGPASSSTSTPCTHPKASSTLLRPSAV